MKLPTTQRSPKILRILVGDCKIRQKPGDGYVTFGYLYPSYVFRATAAQPVEGIDYDAFMIRGVWVGQYMQWHGAPGGEPWPVTDLFEKWDVPMTTMQMGLDCTIQFINVSDKPQPFAVMLVGKLLR